MGAASTRWAGDSASSPRLLLLAPSAGFGGGIERVADAVALTWQGSVTRVDLVPPDNPEALSQAILRLVDDSQLRARLGQASRALVKSRHRMAHFSETLLRACA